MDFGRSFPLPKELSHKIIILDHSRSHQRLCQLLNKQLPIGLRQEGRPRKRFVDSLPKCRRIMYSKASQDLN